MLLWVATFFCMAALAGQQWARPVRRDGCAPQCGGDCHVTASAAANGGRMHERAGGMRRCGCGRESRSEQRESHLRADEFDVISSIDKHRGVVLRSGVLF